MFQFRPYAHKKACWLASLPSEALLYSDFCDVQLRTLSGFSAPVNVL